MPASHQARPLTTLLLDLDGTLLHSSRHLRLAFIRQALNRLAPEIGYTRALQAMTAVSSALQHGGRQAPSPHGPHSNWLRSVAAFQRVTRQPTRDEAAAQLASLYQHIFNELAAHFRAEPFNQALISYARARGLALVLATNPIWTKEVTRLRMTWAGLDAADFQLITHAENMHHIKPDPAYYRELLVKLGCKPGECLMLGNDARKDGAARQLGIDVHLLAKPSRAGSSLGAFLLSDHLHAAGIQR